MITGQLNFYWLLGTQICGSQIWWIIDQRDKNWMDLIAFFRLIFLGALICGFRVDTKQWSISSDL